MVNNRSDKIAPLRTLSSTFVVHLGGVEGMAIQSHPLECALWKIHLFLVWSTAGRLGGSPSHGLAFTRPGNTKSKARFTVQVAAPPTCGGALKLISHVHINVHYPIQRPIFDLHQISPKLLGTTPCYLGF